MNADDAIPQGRFIHRPNPRAWAHKMEAKDSTMLLVLLMLPMLSMLLMLSTQQGCTKNVREYASKYSQINPARVHKKYASKYFLLREYASKYSLLEYASVYSNVLGSHPARVQLRKGVSVPMSLRTVPRNWVPRDRECMQGKKACKAVPRNWVPRDRECTGM